jgi:hypothetical protein
MSPIFVKWRRKLNLWVPFQALFKRDREGKLVLSEKVAQKASRAEITYECSIHTHADANHH